MEFLQSPASPYRYTLVDGDAEVGRACLSPSGYVWGVEVEASLRGRGYGRRLMLCMIDEARHLGHPWVRVRVHRNNRTAVDLYGRLGFKERNVKGADSKGYWDEYELEIDG